MPEKKNKEKDIKLTEEEATRLRNREIRVKELEDVFNNILDEIKKDPQYYIKNKADIDLLLNEYRKISEEVKAGELLEKKEYIRVFNKADNLFSQLDNINENSVNFIVEGQKGVNIATLALSPTYLINNISALGYGYEAMRIMATIAALYGEEVALDVAVQLDTLNVDAQHLYNSIDRAPEENYVTFILDLAFCRDNADAQSVLRTANKYADYCDHCRRAKVVKKGGVDHRNQDDDKMVEKFGHEFVAMAEQLRELELSPMYVFHSGISIVRGLESNNTLISEIEVLRMVIAEEIAIREQEAVNAAAKQVSPGICRVNNMAHSVIDEEEDALVFVPTDPIAPGR